VAIINQKNTKITRLSFLTDKFWRYFRKIIKEYGYQNLIHDHTMSFTLCVSVCHKTLKFARKYKTG